MIKLYSLLLLFFSVCFFPQNVHADTSIKNVRNGRTESAIPSITFSPASGTVGTLLTINGQNLQNSISVTVGGKSAVIVSKSSDKVTALVMPGSETGNVVVSTDGGSITSANEFSVAPSSSSPAVQDGNKIVSPFGSLGYSFALSADGNTAVAGIPTSNGRAIIYKRVNGEWTEDSPPLTGTGGTNSLQGVVDISADGKTVILGGEGDNSGIGAAWIFVKGDSGGWQQQGGKLVGTQYMGKPYMGASVNLSADGNTAVVAGREDNNLGAIWIFTRAGGVWSQQGNKLTLTGNIGPAYVLGTSYTDLSADGNTLIVGNRIDDSLKGAAFIFTRTNGIWSQQGPKLVGTGAVGAAQQGFSVSISADGNTAVVGGRADNSNQGAFWTFTRSGGTWSQQGEKVLAADNVGNSVFGSSVSLSADGLSVVVGGQGDDSSKGATWLFSRENGLWRQTGKKYVGENLVGSAQTGMAVSISADGKTFITGGRQDDRGKGALWVFKRTPDSFSPTATLSGLSISNGNLNPAFSPDTLVYYTTVPNNIGQVKLVPVTASSNSTIKVNEVDVISGQQSGDISLKPGKNVLLISVKSADNSESIYSVVVTRELSAVSTLSALNVDGVPLPAFSPEVKEYMVSVPIGVTSVSIQPYVSDPSAVVTLNRQPILGPLYVNLNIGHNLTHLTVYAENGNYSTDYLINVTRVASTVSSLSQISLSAGSLTETFDQENDIYHASVTNTTNSIRVLFTKAEANATVKVNGIAAVAQSGDINLAVGDNELKVEVTAQDGSTKSLYNIYVRRAPESRFTLTGLESSSGGLTPVYNAETNVYAVSLNNSVESIRIKPTAFDALSVLKVNGSAVSSGTFSNPIPLSTGLNEIEIEVSLAGEITVNNYLVNVTRKALSPVISNFTPALGRVGTLVTIEGSYLTDSKVSIGGKEALIISSGETSLVAMVMPGAVSGVISVTTSGGSVAGSSSFNILEGVTEFSQQGGELLATDNIGNAAQGISVALSADGNTAVAGGFSDNNYIGATWIYRRNNGEWIQDGDKLVGSGSTGFAHQGASVAISADGKTVASLGFNDDGGKGAIWVFSKQNGTWSQMGLKLTAAGRIGVGNSVNQIAMSADGKTIIAGTFDDADMPSVWVFNLINGAWAAESLLTVNGATGARFQGTSVAISADGKTIIAGSSSDNSWQGAGWIFVKTTNGWKQQGPKLSYSGASILGLGWSVALSADGNTAAVTGGGSGDVNGGTLIFTRSSDKWSQQGGILVHSLPAGKWVSPYSTALSAQGDFLVVSDIYMEKSRGRSFLYTRSNGVWSSKGSLLGVGYVPGSNEYQGSSLAISSDGTTILAGAPPTNYGQGRSWVFSTSSSNSTLLSLKLSPVSLLPVFSSGIKDYTGSVLNDISSVRVIAKAMNSGATITVGGISAQDSVIADIPLSVGLNEIPVLSTSQDGASQTIYAIKVTRREADAPILSSLTLGSAVLSPVFDPGMLTYTSSVPASTTSIAVTPTSPVASSTITVNNLPAVNGVSSTVDLQPGSNLIKIVVTLADGITKSTYTVDITREEPTGPALTSLAINQGILSPVFDPGVRNYTVNVGYQTSELTLIPTFPVAYSTTVNTKAISSDQTYVAPLNVGYNMIVIYLSSNTSGNNYAITVNRAGPSAVSTLSSLAVNSGNLEPAFSSATMDYIIAVANGRSSIKVTGALTDTSARFKVNGIPASSGLASGDIMLAVGANAIPIEVTANDGSTVSNYKLNVIRAALNQAIPDNSGSVTINSDTPQALITAPTLPVTISVPAGVTNASLNYSSLINSGTGKIPQTTVTSTLAGMSIPASTSVTSSNASWNGVINMPSPTTYQIPDSPGEVTNYGVGIEVGSPDVSLEFDRAVRLVLPGEAGKRAGFVRGGVFTEITTNGLTDSQSEGDALPAKGAYKIDVGPDLVIWTKGFSKFITFSRSVDPNIALLALDKQALTETSIAGTNASLNSVLNSLAEPLPASGVNGSAITWTSSHPAILSAAGVLQSRPAFADVSVTLTATLTKGLISDTKTFTITVPGAVPLNNINARSTAVSCKGSSNGAIDLTAGEALNYTATITGAVTKILTFTSSLNVPDLSPGIYNVCITAEGLSTYKQCYELVIAEPKDLAAYAVVNKEDGTITLDLSGGSVYNIELNGSRYTTDKDKMLLSLDPGENRILVTTDKVCQGIIEHLVNIAQPLPYPNPFDNLLSIELGSKTIKKVIAEIRDLSGRISYREQFADRTGTLTLNVPQLQTGMHLLKLSLDGKESTHKVMKK